MCIRTSDLADGILDVSNGQMRAAQAKWSRLTPGDLSAIRNKQDLISSVRERYSLAHQTAVQDVELWDARVRSRKRAAGPRSLAHSGIVT